MLILSISLHIYLLFLISGFGIFLAIMRHLKKIKIIWIIFIKRFSCFLLLLDILAERSFSYLIEGLTEATFVFGLLSNNQPDVIGVSWTIGVIFLFYMLFLFLYGYVGIRREHGLVLWSQLYWIFFVRYITLLISLL